MENLLDNLNQEQTLAVRHTSGPLLIVAGAGTGKTTVITRRIAHLVEQKLATPEQIVALTFTEKAAKEMSERVDILMPLGHYDQWICTFHGFCERVLKAHALDIGLPNDFTLLDATEQWIFMYKNLESFDLDYYRPLGSPAKFIDAMLSHFSRCKDEVITPEDYLEYARSLRLQLGQAEKVSSLDQKIQTPEGEELDEAEISRIEELANAYHTYQGLMLKNNYLDFGDLINYTVHLFKKRPKILTYYQNKFKFVMVDEFQDTNFAQYELVTLLSGSHKNVVVVGDDDQSIYKFRGASVSNILKFANDYPGLTQIALIENYRSTQPILDLAYNFIQGNNPDRLEVKLHINKRLKSNIQATGVIEVLEADNLAGELNCVINKIIALKNEGEKSWNEFAILLRRNASANELLPLLTSAGIPFTFVANRGLYKKPIIVDILAYLQLLDNFHNSAGLYRILTLPKFHINPQEVATLLQEAHKKGSSLYDVFLNIPFIASISSESRTKIETLVECLKNHAALAKKAPVTEVFVHVVKDLGFEEKLNEETIENAENRELVEQFFQKIVSFEEKDSDRSLHNFLFNLKLELEAGSEGDIKFDPTIGPETLKVMTVHASKGLEFTYVFVITMVDQRFPTREKSEAIEIPIPLVKDILPEGDYHLQEERRLFYVAVTRAKTNLYFSWSPDYGGARTKKPSLFLTETKLVPSNIISKATGKVVFTKPKQAPVVFQNLPVQFSYSQLNDFETCPLKYKYQHYLKLPVPGSCHLSFGQTIHKVLEEYLKLYKNNLELPQQDLFGGKPSVTLPDFKFLEALYVKHWVDDWYRDAKERDDYKKRGHAMLQTFYGKTVLHPFVPKYIEKFFKLPLGPYNFVGKIDRADIVPGGIHIWDYKTGKIPKKSVKKDLDQLHIYQWAAQEYLRERVAQLNYWYLLDEEGIKEEAVTSPEKIEKLKATIFEKIEKIIETTKYDTFKQVHEKTSDHKCEYEFME